MRLQEVEENAPTPALDQLMSPVGEYPITAAVQELDVPTTTGEGEHVTVVLVWVVPVGVAFNVKVEELPALLVSPE